MSLTLVSQEEIQVLLTHLPTGLTLLLDSAAKILRRSVARVEAISVINTQTQISAVIGRLESKELCAVLEARPQTVALQ